MNNKFSFFAATLLISVAQIAYAEGSIPAGGGTGSNGVNRRVLTEPASSGAVSAQYCGVRGLFGIPTIFVPLGGRGLGFLQPNKANSKPTFYLGARAPSSNQNANFEIDAGVQYDWKAGRVAAYTDPSTGVDVPSFPVAPGYLVYVRNSNADFTSDQFWPALGGWRCGPGTLNPDVSTFNLEWSFLNAGPASQFYTGVLKVDAKGAVSQPRDPNDGGVGRIYAAGGALLRQNIIGMRMKRVVGVTQGSEAGYPVTLNFPLGNPNPYYEEDGTYVKRCRFLSGEIATNARVPSWVPWSSVPIDQTQTGSSPGPNVTDRTFKQPPALRGMPVRSPDPNIASKPVFVYSDLGDTPIPSTSVLPARYSDESVDINLRRAVPIIGEVVIPGGIYGGTEPGFSSQ